MHQNECYYTGCVLDLQSGSEEGAGSEKGSSRIDEEEAELNLLEEEITLVSIVSRRPTGQNHSVNIN